MRELMYAGLLISVGWVFGFCAAAWSAAKKDGKRDW
jgi:hypothetical protein